MSITDPWAVAETEPASAEADRYGHAPNPTSASDVKPNIVSPSGDKITMTFKGTGTYSDRWLVAHVANPAEGLELLKDPEFKELLDLSKRIAAYDGAGAAAPAPQGSSTPARSNVPQGATEPPAWAPPKPFDDYVYKSKISAKTGKVWYAWMPPTQDDPREPKFFYPPN